MEERTVSSTGGKKGVKLERHDLIPATSLKKLAEHFGRGALKYDAHQWRQGYEWSKSYSAIQRHLLAFWSGLDYDVCSNDPGGCSFITESGEAYVPTGVDVCYNHTGSHHMTAVAWHSFVLMEFSDRFPQHDDRFIPADLLEIDHTPDI